MHHNLTRSCALLITLSLANSVFAVPRIEVNGRVDLNGDFVAESNKTDFETGPPLARTSVTVADELPGVWKYSATSDITVPKLQIFGSLDNSGGGQLGPGEAALLRVNAQLADTITITTPSADPYLVEADLLVHGLLAVAGSNGRVIAQIAIDPLDQLSKSEFRTYDSTSPTVINDTLPIVFEFTGNAEFDLTSALFFFVTEIDAGASITADFSNTAIVNIKVTTLGGDPISNVTITSQSGQFGTAVPLPATLPLLLSGFVGLYRQRRRAII